MFKKHSESMPNELLNGNGFFISYNPNPCSEIEAWHSDNKSAETALVYKGRYYILNGDFRKQYLEVYEQGIEKCLEIFKQNEAHKSSWSD